MQHNYTLLAYTATVRNGTLPPKNGCHIAAPVLGPLDGFKFGVFFCKKKARKRAKTLDLIYMSGCTTMRATVLAI